MLIKAKDSLEEEILRRERELAGRPSIRRRHELEKQVARIRAGIDGENEAAYHIEFHLGSSQNWATIHDLRLEWKGRVAQIDHLLITRFLEAYIVESKNIKTKVRYENRVWQRIIGNQWEGIPSPSEQNHRHILVLQELIANEKLAPVMVGITLPLTFKNVVLVHPTCSLEGKFPKGVQVFPMDSLMTEIRKEAPSALSILTLISSQDLLEFCRKLVTYHTPVHFEPQQRNPTEKTLDRARCEGCGGAITAAEIAHCKERKSRFAGALLCRMCQQFASKKESNEKCRHCGDDVSGKVADFCRSNNEMFGGQILCWECQKPLKAKVMANEKARVP